MRSKEVVSGVKGWHPTRRNQEKNPLSTRAICDREEGGKKFLVGPKAK